MDRAGDKTDSKTSAERQRIWRAAHGDLNLRRKAAAKLLTRIRKDYKHYPHDVKKPRSGQFHYSIGTPRDPNFKAKPPHEFGHAFVKRRLDMVFDDLVRDRRTIYYHRCKRTGVHGYLLVDTSPAPRDDEDPEEYQRITDRGEKALDLLQVPPPLRSAFKVVRIVDIYSCVFSDVHLFTGFLDLTPFSVDEDHTLRSFFDFFDSLAQELCWDREGIFQFITLSPLSSTDLAGVKSFQYRFTRPTQVRDSPLWAVPLANAMIPDGPITEPFEERMHFWSEYLSWKRSGLFLSEGIARGKRFLPWFMSRLLTLREDRRKRKSQVRKEKTRVKKG